MQRDKDDDDLTAADRELESALKSLAPTRASNVARLTPLTPALYPFFSELGGSVPAKPTWRLIGQRGRPAWRSMNRTHGRMKFAHARPK